MLSIVLPSKTSMAAEGNLTCVQGVIKMSIDKNPC